MLLHQYKATLIRVIDGDTIDLNVDLGFRIKNRVRFRLIGIDTPELRSDSKFEKEMALVAKEYVEAQFMAYNKECYLRSNKKGSWGRWLADVYFKDTEGRFHSLSEMLLNNGMADPYAE